MVNIGYLLRLEDAVNANITPIQRDGRQAQRGIRCIMVFVQKPGNLVRKHRQNRVLAELTSISMQYHFPSKRSCEYRHQPGFLAASPS